MSMSDITKGMNLKDIMVLFGFLIKPLWGRVVIHFKYILVRKLKHHIIVVLVISFFYNPHIRQFNLTFDDLYTCMLLG